MKIQIGNALYERQYIIYYPPFAGNIARAALTMIANGCCPDKACELAESNIALFGPILHYDYVDTFICDLGQGG